MYDGENGSGRVGAWERNAGISIDIAGDGGESIDYRTLLIALCLAEAGGDPDVAQRAIEEQALPDGFEVGVHAFGSQYPCHTGGHPEPEELELAVRLARHFIEGADSPAEPEPEPEPEDRPDPLPPAQRRAEQAYDLALRRHDRLLDALGDRLDAAARVRLQDAVGEVYTSTEEAIRARLQRLRPDLTDLIDLATGVIEPERYAWRLPEEDAEHAP